MAGTPQAAAAAPEADPEQAKTGNRSFEGTPLDPRKSLKSFMKKKKKKGKKKKRSGKKSKKSQKDKGSSSSDSESSGDSGSSSLDSDEAEHPFKETHRIRRLAEKRPGVLGRNALEEIWRLMSQTIGEDSPTVLAPTFVKYLRLFVMGKTTAPGMKRELLTLGYSLDRLLKRDILGAVDVLTQRLKAIELVHSGSSWLIAQKLELVPQDQERITGLAEAHEAAREFRQESKVTRELGGKGSGKQWQPRSEWKGNPKGEEKGKGGGKEEGKGKRNQGKWGNAAAKVDPMKPN